MQNYWVFRIGVEGNSASCRLTAVADGVERDRDTREYRWVSNYLEHKVVVQGYGKHIGCWVDRDMVASGVDDTPDGKLTGYVMLVAPKTATRFRDLLVTNLDLPERDPRRVVVSGCRALEIAGDADPAIQLQKDTEWRGDYQQTPGYRASLMIRITERKGTRFEGEIRAGLPTPLGISGNVDARGNITYWAREVGAEWFPENRTKLVLGTIRGNTLGFRAYFPEQRGGTDVLLRASLAAHP
jgi:hypothetical protein